MMTSYGIGPVTEILLLTMTQATLSFRKWATSEVALDGKVTVSIEALGAEKEETSY